MAKSILRLFISYNVDMCANIEKSIFFRVSPQSNQSINDSQQKTKASTQDIFLNGISARYAEGDNTNRSKCEYLNWGFCLVLLFLLLLLSHCSLFYRGYKFKYF